MEATKLPLLSTEEIRVLGSLIEKSRTTPDYYPMTLNSLTTACNQKSSRKPMVNYDEETVVLTLDSLKRKGLISTATGGGSRVVKYKHNLALVFPLVPAQLTIICLLLLRGPQTLGELNTNSGRLYEFESLENVQRVVDELINFEPSFLIQLPKRTGQKEARFTHLLAGEPNINDDEMPEEPARKSVSELELRIATLEENYALLKADLDHLMKELMG
ncbi:MAG: YceH family protein [Bacteroidetes bacterium]|nr:YceH family protein [Bacteroidota bacterium]MBU1371276.1 YceH family protein [Bacteroidota bacterium]MBU1485763.1 YceH family protein [Bacteroidota bacterium]MBU1762209.1 YceH family protein [Bacteroidota bacterium]MBU2269610.1 YceH family protein [Bacteroidota bacterium]